MQPDPPLSPAALDVRHELERFARLNPDLPATALAWHLARKWIPGWLRKPRWWQRRASPVPVAVPPDGRETD